MERLDNWRYMDATALRAEIWSNAAPANANRWTIVKPDIAATTETVISFTTSKRPKMTTTSRNAITIAASDSANQVERLGYAIYDTIERTRDVPLVREIADHAFHRGCAVTKVLRLSPEERGAVTEEIDAAPVYDDPDLNSDNESMEVVVSEEKFPNLTQPLDPYECAWMTAPDGKLLEFVHEYDDSPDNVLATFPDLEGNTDFEGIVAPESAGTIKVTDYWTEEEHCILINGLFFKKPTRHEYPGIPIVVDLAAPRTRRYTDRGQFAREGTPFCANMLDAISKLSMAESWMTANLEEVAFPFLVHSNIDPNESPYMKAGAGNVSEYTFDLQMGPSKSIVPTFTNDHGGERLGYPDLPPAAPALMQFAGARLRDSALMSFPESVLSGAQTADVSGYAYAQMKQAAFSRVSPYQSTIDRHLSRVMELNVKLLVHDWDRGPEIPLLLTQLVGQQNQAEETLKVSKEMLAAIGNIRVEIQPELPIDLEKEWTMYFQAGAQGYMGARTVMNKMGQVEDPTIEFEDMIAERFAMEDPAARAAILQKWMLRNGYKQPQQAQQPQQPMAPGMAPGAAPPGAMGPAPPPSVDPMTGMPMDPAMLDPAMGGMPMDPAMLGGDPLAGMNGGAPPMAPGDGEMTPELMMQLLQQGGV